jgi:hypothetical protein
VVLRISQQRQERQQLVEGARPPVGQYQGERVRTAPALVDEVQIKPVDLPEEVRDTVQLALLRPPVERGAPVLDELAKEARVHTFAPHRTTYVRRPASALEPLREIVKDLLCDVDLERPRPAHPAGACSQLVSPPTSETRGSALGTRVARALAQTRRCELAR